MCSPRKIFKAVDAVVNPVGAVISNNVSQKNAARQIVDPTGIARERYAEGDSLTAKSALDPGTVFTKSDQQVANLEWEAGQAERDRIAAEQDATKAANSKTALLKRRRASSALATGAQGGTGALSSVLAYGKSTFG